MKHHTPTRFNRGSLAGLKWLSATVLVASLAACGGGSESSTPATGKSYKGTVTALDNAQSFRVDGIVVDASGSNAVPQGLATGTRVEIQGSMVNGKLVALRVELDDDNHLDDNNTDPNELDGRVTAYSGPTRFSVDGIAVDASASPVALAVGMRVEVYGAMTNGTMVASRVKIEGQNGSDDSDDSNDDRDDDRDSDDDKCTAVNTLQCDDDREDDRDDEDDKDEKKD